MIPNERPAHKILSPRRKRSLLSFRRKTDLAWFLLTLVMFSSGMTAFALAGWFLRRPQQPNEVPFERAAPVALLKDPIARTPPPPIVVEKPVERKPARQKPVAPPPPAKPKRPTTVKVIPENKSFNLLQEARSPKREVDGPARLSTKMIDLNGEKELKLNYDLAQGEWVQASLSLRADLRTFSRVQFLFRGEGASNTFEFKVVDSDGTNVGTSWPRQSGNTAWTVVDLVLSDLPYLWGGDTTLDWKRVRQIYFAVSKKKDDQGGRGRVTIRGVRFL
jgi:hypothetical protein